MAYYQSQYFGQNPSLFIVHHMDLNFPTIHYHRDYELLYLEGESLRVLLDDKQIVLTKGEILLIHPNQIHAYFSTGNTPCRMAIFSPDYVNSFYQSHMNMKPKNTVTKYSCSTSGFIEANLFEGNNIFAIKACLYAACAEVSRQTEFISMVSDKLLTQSHRILHFVEENYLKNITLQDCAVELHYDYKYLSRLINKTFNRNFSDIVNAYKIDYAKNLLNHSNLPITQIAFDCGFDNIRTFNRNFFRFMKISPSEYKALPVND